MRLPAPANRINTRRRVQLGLAGQTPPIWPLPYRPNMDGRIEALEAALAGEATRYRQRQTIFNLGPKPFAGTTAESVEDFFSDFERYLTNHEIQVQHASRYLPDFLVGTAQEFYRTLPEAQLRDVTTLRNAFVNHFATQARRQAALQNFYKADQSPSESANQYYYGLKTLARAAFHNTDAAARAQQVTGRMRQGIRPDLRRILIGRDFETAEDLRAAIENIELEIASPKDTTAVTREDLKEILQSLKNTSIDNRPNRISNINAIDEGDTQAVATISRNTAPRRVAQFYNNGDSRQCLFCGRRGHIQRDCLARKRNVFQTRRPPNEMRPCAPNTVELQGRHGATKMIDHVGKEKRNHRYSNE